MRDEGGSYGGLEGHYQKKIGRRKEYSTPREKYSRSLSFLCITELSGKPRILFFGLVEQQAYSGFLSITTASPRGSMHSMDSEVSTTLWHWMNVLTLKRYTELKHRFGTLSKAYDALDLELLLSLGIREDSAMKALTRVEELDIDALMQKYQKLGINILSLEDEVYPEALRTLPDAPVFLAYRGDLSVLKEPCIALVGAREMTSYGKRVTEMMVPSFVQACITTVSGLAEGIDALVAKETLSAGGKTVAVLGHGFGMMFPKAHENLAEEILNGGGLIISEFPFDTRPDKYTFPARNRIIAGLSMATVVLQAAEESGSLITAELALEYGREVFAVPGDIFDPSLQGSNAILKRGEASLARSADDVLSELGFRPSSEAQAKNSYMPTSPESKKIFDVLSTLPLSIDLIVEKTGLAPSAVSAALTMMEIDGVVENVGGGEWVRK